MKNPTYTDEELSPFFAEISKGFTIDQAIANIGYCCKKMNTAMVDIEVRQHIMALHLAQKYSK